MSIDRRPLRYAHTEGHTDLCYTDDGSHIITCGNDGDIRLWVDIEDAEPESFCVGESAFSVSQKGENIYVCRDDGRVTMLKYPDGERNGTLTRFTAPATHITVAKDEPIIACVSEDFSVKVFNIDDENNSTTFNEMKGPALGVSISSDGNLLAASCGDGKVYVWNVLEKKLLKSIDCVPTCNSFTSAKVLGRVSFDPKSKFLAYPNGKEIIIVNTDQFEKVYSLSTDKVDAPFSIAQFSPCGAHIAGSTTKGDICVWRSQPKNEAIVSAHEQKYNICALAWNPADKTEISFCDVNGQMGTVKLISDNAAPSLPSYVEDTDMQITDFDDEDNENAISLEKIKNETMGLLSPSAAADFDDGPSRAQSPDRPISPPCTLQPPFQPGSTPVQLTERFMVFNDVGIVRLHKEDESSSIDVQFHDATLYKNIFMKNYLNHTMASISTSVLVLACETPSKLVCIPLKSGSKEWSTSLSDLEEILCVTASTTLVAVATNVRMLRIFSVFGSQRAVISIPGPVVSLASYKNYIFVVYHACTAHAKDQNLSGMLVQLNGLNVSSQIIPLPITPLSNLMWIGFTDVGSLATYDSGGIVRINRLNSGTWIPVCDTTVHAKGASDSYFLIHVTESNQTIRVIHCKGSMYPATTPLPLLIELPLQIPFCELETDKAQLEDKLFRWTYFETDQPEKTFKETAIKLFALACRNNLDDRAFELLEMLDSPQLVNIALKYANKLGRSRLVDKLSDLIKKLQGDSENEENNPRLSIRPAMHRPNKTRAEPSQSVVSQPLFTPEVLTNNSVTEDLTSKDDSIFIKTNTKNPFLKSVNGEHANNPFKITATKNNTLDGNRNSDTQTKNSSLKSVNDEHVKNPFKMTHTPTNKNNGLDGSSKTENDNENSASQNLTVHEGETFQVWFKRQKAELQEQNPDMAVENLAKLALKLYKKQAAKRKASGEADGSSQKSKQAKLSAYAFSK